jgi:tRNA(fMet)-specific endonuclease VapC
MTYMLDTNACISYLNHADSPIRMRLQQLDPKSVAVCAVVEAELYFGAINSCVGSSQNLASLKFFLSAFKSFPFDSRAARRYGEIRFLLKQAGTPIGPNDVLIASIALANDDVLITHNTREFSRINNLKIEDWQGENLNN